MSGSTRMTPLELRASLGLSAIFGLRLFGMFVILPVFAIYAERLPGGNDLALVGLAIGAYGLTQSILQIPFGWWSDRYGRKPVVYIGLVIFAIGSFTAAVAGDIYMVILGRVLQGGGAVSAAVVAMTADLTREEQRTKAMAMIGSTIGLSFALSLVVSPWLARVIGVPGIFAMTGVLALLGILIVWRVVPEVPQAKAGPGSNLVQELKRVLLDPQLARLNFGIFALHAVLMALFIAVPFSLRDAGLPLDQHWKVYLPVMLGSFILMLPAVLGSGRTTLLKFYFTLSVGVLTVAHVLFPWLSGSVWLIGVFLLLFFTPFNILEAMLPSLTSRLAPPAARGTAMGVYSSIQFFGTFIGSATGGYAYGRWGAAGIVIFDVVLLVIWLILSFGMQLPAARAVAPAGGQRGD
jgi:MFS family permease